MREYIEAGEGKILTNGEAYGKKIYLAEGMEKDAFYEITEEEYKKISEKTGRETEGMKQ